MIIVSITGPTMSDAREQIRRSRADADLVELRLDLLSEPRLAELVRAAGRPVVATCRPAWEGGAFEGTEERRRDVLSAGARAGARYVDVELRAGKPFREAIAREAPRAHLIVSYHRLTDGPLNVRSLYRELDATGAYVVKFAYNATEPSQNRNAYDFLALARRGRRRAVALAMGEAGELSRVAYRAWGGWATYASSGVGHEAAPGQLPARMLRSIYRVHRLNRRTRFFGVVGSPLTQSKGVFVHNALFRRHRVNAVYCKLPVHSLEAFMRDIAPLMSGFSVTIPHKESILRYLDDIDPAARSIGAVNTVVRRSGKLLGSNTDAPAALDALEEVATVRGRRVLVVGAGGAARAIAYEANRRGASVTVVARSPGKAMALARDLGVRSAGTIVGGSFDILVNCTPVGMTPAVDESPVPAHLLGAGTVFDAVYNPPETRLLREARAAGAVTVSGVEMYLNQALLQAKLYMRRKPDKNFMRRILNRQMAAGRLGGREAV